MSTVGPLEPQPQAHDGSAYGASGFPVLAGGFSTPGSVDPLLIQQTKNEIRTLVQEITQLSRADISVEQFHEEFLRRVVAALAAQGGAIWTTNEKGTLEVQYQINVPADDLSEHEAARQRHILLLRNVIASRQATLVPPRSGSPADEEAGNPTDCLLILAPLRVDQQALGVIEVFQRAGGGPTTQRGYLRFLLQMSELAGEFLRNRRLRHLGDREVLWERLEQFVRRAHRRLDSQATALTIVNEGRRLIECDRVSLALAQGKRQRIAAVSGLDTLDRRSEELNLLGRLATAVAAAGRPLWYAGREGDIPPQIERHLDAYLDRARAKMLAVVPLYGPEDESDSRQPDTLPAAPFGALIIEQMRDNRIADGLQDRVAEVALHSALALGNALDHERLFLLPLWQALGKAKWVVRARNLPRILLALAGLISLALGSALVPADFELAARGKLQPCLRRDIFAHSDGLILDVAVRHAQFVTPGQVLIRMSNHSLEVEKSNLIGRQRTTQERIRNVQRAQLDDRRLTIEEQNRLAGELLELRQVEESIDRELQLLEQKEEQLVVRSEIQGQVLTWNVAETLLRRPVQRGQLLMTVVDPRGDWELELFMPERRMGHIARAASQAAAGLQVSFFLASHPDRRLTGHVSEIQRTAETRDASGNSVLLRVAIDRRGLPDLRSETSVTARVHCGRRAIGYVLFHDVLEALQSRVLFWL